MCQTTDCDGQPSIEQKVQPDVGSLLGPSAHDPRSEPLTARLAPSSPAAPQGPAGFRQKLPPVILRSCCLHACNKTTKSPLIRDPDPLLFHSIAPRLLLLPAINRTTRIILPSSHRTPAVLCLCRNIPPSPGHLPRNIDRFIRHRLPPPFPPPKPHFSFPLPPSLRTPPTLRGFELPAV